MARTKTKTLEAQQRASALQTRQTLLNALAGAHEVAEGTLYDCPLCGGARKLLIQTNKSDDPNYLYSFWQLCSCDHQQLSMRLMELAGIGSFAVAAVPAGGDSARASDWPPSWD